MPAPGQQVLAPGQQVLAPGQQVPAPGQQVPAPGQQVPAPSQQVPAPGQQVPAPGQQVLAPGQQVLAPGQQVLAPGQEGDGEANILRQASVTEFVAWPESAQGKSPYFQGFDKSLPNKDRVFSDDGNGVKIGESEMILAHSLTHEENWMNPLVMLRHHWQNTFLLLISLCMGLGLSHPTHLLANPATAVALSPADWHTIQQSLGVQDSPASPTWTQTAKLSANNPSPDDRFGFAVAVSGNTVVVGAAFADTSVSNDGAAYVFERTTPGGPLTQVAKLHASNPSEEANFGVSVAVSGSVVVVGAYLNDTTAGVDSGSAYVFVRPEAGWSDMTETAQLSASNAAANDLFGIAVAIRGTTAVVGAYQANAGRGTAYLYEQPQGGWSNMTETAKLTGNDSVEGDFFGFAVSLNETATTLLVGAPLDNATGSAYVFVRPTNGWVNATQTAKLTASDGLAIDFFAISVGISSTANGETAVAGAYATDQSGSYSGSAYVFVRPAGGWINASQTAKLTASDATAQDQFGRTVAISSDVIAIGAPFENATAGSAYLFVRPATGWVNGTETDKIVGDDTGSGDNFGYAIALENGVVVVGAEYDDDGGTNSGAAVVFEEELAGLTAVNNSPTILGNTTTFTATLTSGTALSYTWAFGDGQSGVGAVISHTYGAIGSYTATVTATAGVQSQTAWTVVTVAEPISGLTAVNNSPTDLGNATAFTATVTSGSDVGYTWDFGNGQTANGATVSTIYPASGIFTATVTASNSLGTATASTLVTIVQTETPIEGLLAVNNSPTALGQGTHLTATVSAGTAVSYTWAFGDGQSGSGAVISHTYAASGTFTATVTATNSLGSQTAWALVAVEEAIAGLTAVNDSPTTLGNATTFTASVAAGSSLVWVWAFGDGQSAMVSNTLSVSHTYTTSGNYTATVTASNLLGSETASTAVTVTAVTPLYFVYLPTALHVPPAIQQP